MSDPQSSDPQSDIILEKLQSYIEMRFIVEFDGETVDHDTDLFQAGIMDSFGIVDVVSFIESTFEVSFTDSDLTSPRIACLGGLVELISERQTD